MFKIYKDTFLANLQETTQKSLVSLLTKALHPKEVEITVHDYSISAVTVDVSLMVEVHIQLHSSGKKAGVHLEKSEYLAGRWHSFYSGNEDEISSEEFVALQDALRQLS